MMSPLLLLALLGALLSGCSALTTTGEVLDVLVTTPREDCERSGGAYSKVYDAKTGAVLSETCTR